MSGSPKVLADLAHGLRIVNAGSDHVLTGQRLLLRVLPLAASLEMRASPPDFPVRVNAKWSLTREDGTAVANADYEAPDGLASPQVSLVLRSSLTAGAKTPKVKLRVHCQVQLSSGAQTTDWMELVPSTLYVVALPYLSEVLDRLPQDFEVLRAGSGPVDPGQPLAVRLQQAPGSRPLPDEVPLRMETLWSIVREKDGAELSRDQDYEAPEGLRSPNATFLFPALIEPGAFVPSPLKLRVHARVRLSAGELTTGWKALNPLPLGVNRLPDVARVLDTVATGLQIVRFGPETVHPPAELTFAVQQVSGPRPPVDVPVRVEATWEIRPAEATHPLPVFQAEGLQTPRLSLRFLPQEISSTRVAVPVGLRIIARVQLSSAQEHRELERTVPLSVMRLADSTAAS